MKKSLSGLRVLVTAGPTREYMDPVRFLTNASSGRMGYEVAKSFYRAGAQVVLISGPTAIRVSKGIRLRSVESALEMQVEVKKRIASTDVFIATAAVGDWRFEKIGKKKQKKGRSTRRIVRLVANPDILAEVGSMKEKRHSDRPILIGFSLETERVTFHALEKLKRKNLDLIIGNTPSSFSNALIRACWIEKTGFKKMLVVMRKKKLANLIRDWVQERIHGRR